MRQASPLPETDVVQEEAMYHYYCQFMIQPNMFMFDFSFNSKNWLKSRELYRYSV